MIAWLVAHGPTMLLGSTLVLGTGWLLMRLQRSPVDRHRLGVWTALATLLFLVAAVSPLPRWSWATTKGTAAVTGDAPPHSVATNLAAANPAAARPAADAATRTLLLQDHLDALLATDERSPAATAAATWPAASTGALLVGAYLLGAALVLLRAGLGLLRLFVLLRGSDAAPHELSRGLDLPPHARIRVLPGAVRPFCCALFRPTIVIPAALLTPGNERQLAAVLAHEAAHLRHRDPLTQLLLAVLAVPLWPHPLQWLVARDLRFLGELRADDAAAAQGPTAYARALLTLADADLHNPQVAGTVAVFHHPSDFFRRISMLLQRDGRLHSRSSRTGKLAQAAAMFALTLGAAGVFGVPAAAQDPQDRTLRKQNAQLQEEIATLRAELADLRAALQLELQGAKAPARGVARIGEEEVLIEETVAKAAFDPVATPKVARSKAATDGFVHDDAPPGTHTKLAPGPDGPFTRERAVVTLPQVRRLPAGARTPARDGSDLPAEPAAQSAAPTSRAQRVFLPGDDGLPGHSAMVELLPESAAAPANDFAAIAELTARCIDLVTEVQIQEADLQSMAARAEGGFESAGEVRRAKIRLEGQQRKLDIVMRLLDGEIAATKLDVERLTHDARTLTQPMDKLRAESELRRATTRLQALQAVK